MHRNSRFLLFVTLALIVSAVSSASAGVFTAFGSQTYQRDTGKPATVTQTFSILNPNTQYSLHVTNNGVSSAIVTLNGIVILNPSDFDGTVTSITRSIQLQISNTIGVQLRSAPGSSLSIEVIGIDNDPPTIAAAITPAPNSAGWNNSNVTVSFTCSDATSGVASCPSPVIVSSEGAGEVITGTAFDRAGNSASQSVTISLDKTPPSITASGTPSPNAAKWNNSDVTVGFQCSDSLSGIASCSPPRVVTTEGSNQTISGTATDIAGNSAQATVTLNVDKTPPSIAITSPAENAVLNPGITNLTGTVADSLSGVASVSCNGMTGFIDRGTFSCELNLAAGPNTISVQAADVAGNTSLTTRMVNVSTAASNKTITQAGAVPNGAFLNEPTVVTFTAHIAPDANLIASSVTLNEYDDHQQLIGPVGQMYDDGIHGGDAIAGDNTYTLQVPFNIPSRTTLYFRVSAAYNGSPVAFSQYVRFDAIPHISTQDFATAANTPAAALATYQSLIGKGLSAADAQTQTINWLLQQPGVLQSGPSDNGGAGIWIVYQSGIWGGMILDPPGTRGGAIHAVRGHQSFASPAAALTPRIASPFMFQTVGNNTDFVGNRRVIGIGAFHDEFSPLGDEVDQAEKQTFRNAPCPATARSAKFINQQATVALMKTLSQYGVVIITSHGDTYSWPGGPASSQVVFLTRETPDPFNHALYDVDLLANRLAIVSAPIGNPYYAILPSFITTYDAAFPQSLIYLGSCRSHDNTSMADAFIAQGAKTFFGYRGAVPTGFAALVGTKLFQELTINGKSTGGAFDPNQRSRNPPAVFQMQGDPDLTFAALIPGGKGTVVNFDDLPDQANIPSGYGGAFCADDACISTFGINWFDRWSVLQDPSLAETPPNAVAGSGDQLVNPPRFEFPRPVIFEGAWLWGGVPFPPCFNCQIHPQWVMYLNGSVVATSAQATLIGTGLFLSSGYGGQVDRVKLGLNPIEVNNVYMDDMTYQQTVCAF